MGLTKKKSGKALFEVITTYRQKHPGTGPLMPEWMRRRQQPAAGATAMPNLTPEPLKPEPVPPPAPAAVSTAAPPPPALAPQPARPFRFSRPEPAVEPLAEPMVNTAGGRLTLSLNYVTTVVVAMGMLLLLAGMFVLGRVTAPDQAIKAASTTKPAAMSTTRRAGRAVERPQATSGLFAESLPPKKYYFVIQGMNPETPEAAQKEEIDKIVRHCGKGPADKAVPAARVLYVMKDGSRMWLAVATEPFDTNVVTNRVKELQKRVEALGKDPANPTNYTFKRDKAILIPNEGAEPPAGGHARVP